MSGMSDYTEGKLLDLFFANAALTPPATHVALFTADPTDAAGAGEVSATGTGYARRTVNRDGATAPYWSAKESDGAGGQRVKNVQAVDFPEATAGWGTVTHFGIFDAATGGKLLFHAALTTPKQIDTGDVFRFKAGELSVSFR